MATALTLLCCALPWHPNDGPDVDVRVRIEDRKVIMIIMMNLVFCDEIVKVPRQELEDLGPDEEEPLRQALFSYFKASNEVSIDGVQVTPRDTRFDVPEPEHSLLPLFPRFGLRALFKVRLTLEYSALSPPGSVKFVWGPFPPDYAVGFGTDIPPMEVAAVILAQGEEEVITFRKDEPGYTWHRSDKEPEDRFLPVPTHGTAAPVTQLPMLSLGVLALLLAWGGVGSLSGRTLRWRGPYGVAVVLGLATAAASWDHFRMDAPWAAEDAGLPSEAEALEIFRPLHANIYGAFHFTDRSDIYDALERSVHGDLLESLFNEIYASLVMQEEGGAVSRVTSVRPLETDVEIIGTGDQGPWFQVLARWQVDGSVFHWGHSHHRTNEYQARYSVGQTESGWRISGSETLEQKEVEATIPEPMTPRDERSGK